MLKRYHRVVGTAQRIIDVFVVGLSWLASYYIRFYSDLIPVTKGIPNFDRYISLAPLIMILWSVVFAANGLYSSRRMIRRTDEAQNVVKAHTIAVLLMVSLTFMFTEYQYSRAVLLVFSILCGISLLLIRSFVRNTLRWFRRRGYNLRYVLICGEGISAELLADRVRRFPELGLRLKGVLVHETSSRQNIYDVPVLGTLREVGRVVREQGIDQVWIALPSRQQDEVEGILKSIYQEPVSIRLIPDLHEYLALGCEVEDFEGVPIVNLNDSPMFGFWSWAKRTTDFAVASIGLLLLSPFLGLVALLVRLSSPGPILYRQTRMGLDHREFQMLKFRTMKLDAEDAGAKWAVKNDPRKTRLGSFLRKTSLDELPQLWNVVKGDMSLVGPRPERPVFVDQFRGQIPNYMLRHRVKAGITGWAQVNGWRGDTSLARRIEFDLYYIRNWSYLMDIRILLLTLWKGFINKNAY